MSRIRALWCSLAISAAGGLALHAADPLDAPVHNYRKNNTPAARAAVEAQVPRAGALARLGLGAADLAHGRITEGTYNLEAARLALPKVADHADFAMAEALIAQSREAEALPRLERVIAAQPVSPFRGEALVRAGEILLAAGNAKRAAALLKPHANWLPHPRGTLVYGTALEGDGQFPSAVMQLQRVYYDHPKSPEAAKAEVILRRIKAQLGDAYPPAMGRTMLSRAQKLMEGGDPRRAMEELSAMEPHVAGADRELAKVRGGVARYYARDYRGALQYLEQTPVDSAEADGERLYYWVSAARRLDSESEISRALAEFEKRQPKSEWRAQALIDIANRSLVNNQVDVYEPLYQTCAASAPGSSKGAYCSYRVAWAHYLRRRSDAPALLREHVERFPGTEDVAGALYFLGRIAEERDDTASARAYYEAIEQTYPNYYYAMIARERLALPGIRRVIANKAVLEGLMLRPPSGPPDFEADAKTRVRLERARLLDQAGLEDWAETELRFAARVDAKPHVAAVELSGLMEAQGKPEQGLRYVKSLANGYLGWGFERAPKHFWKAAFPMPFQDSLDRYSVERNLDPHLVAGLIRQESEFDPKALSRSNAVGLTQIMPATGRDLSRRIGVRYFTASMLSQPDYNVRLGTFYLRMLLDSLEKNLAAVLAAYNAGKTRADMWMRWGDFREQAEFIESIPFHETRNYVQIVLRNADMYKRLYGDRKISATPAPPPPAPPAARKSPAPARRPAAARTKTGTAARTQTKKQSK